MVSGSESTEAGIQRMLQGVIKEWEDSVTKGKPGGDTKLADTMEKLTLALRKTQMSEEKSREIRAVRSHIERRAELKEKTSMGMPNIANILTGGAESPMAGLGRMQRKASEPFKASWEYKKAQDEQAELSGKKDRSPEEEDRLKQLGEDMPGREKRAKSGFGKNLMGKKMQSLIGKTGKFMESSKGQGMMAGGMMGASILTMIIKKAMEASPMLQQMLKIMNVAMTLFLRPIGDFIGGMLKPIMLFFLREIAVPMLKKGKDFIKFGEAFGKNLLGFILKPIETIHAGIVSALGIIVGPEMANLAKDFDGMKAWMTEQKMGALAGEMGFEGPNAVQDLVDMINDAKFETPGGSPRSEHIVGSTQFNAEEWAALVAEFGTVVDDDVIPPLTIFKTLMTDLSKNTYSYVTTQMELEGAGIAVAEGMGQITGQFTHVSEATGNVVKEMDSLAERIANQNKQTTPVADGTGATTPVATDTGETQGPPEAVEEAKKHWSEFTGSLAAMFAAAGQQIREGLKAEVGSAEHTQARAEYGELTGKNEITGVESHNVLEGIRQKFEAMQEKVEETTEPILNTIEIELVKRNDLLELVEQQRVPTTHELALREHLASLTETTSNDVETQSKKTVDTYVQITSLVVAGYNKIKSMIASMKRSSAGNKKKKKMQFGGMINEPIWGIGESGTTYELGEAGPEMVIPMNKRGGMGIGPVTINVNVDSINSDVDLEKIKPVVERALQEVHSRRGII